MPRLKFVQSAAKQATSRDVRDTPVTKLTLADNFDTGIDARDGWLSRGDLGRLDAGRP